MNLNGKEFKELRDTLTLWHIADFSKADADITKSTYIKGRQTCIDGNNDRIEKLRNGDKTLGNVTIESLKAENDVYQAQINAETERIKALKAEYDKDYQLGLDLLSEVLVNAISNVALNPFDTDAESALTSELVNFFKKYNDKVVAADVERFVRCSYGAIKVNSSRIKCMDNRHNGAEKSNKVKAIFLGAICDELNKMNLLQEYKWQNIIEKKAKKAADSQTK